MTPLPLGALIGLTAVLILVARGVQQARRARSARDSRAWGQLRNRPRNFAAIQQYYERIRAAAPERGWLDDRTWADLTMDDIFGLVDRTESVVGQQLLYARIRSSPMGQYRAAFSALVAHMQENATVRGAVVDAMARLNETADAADIFLFTEPDALTSRRWHVVFPLIGGGMIVGLVATVYWHPAILVVLSGAVLNLWLRSRAASDLRTAGEAFRQVGPLLTAAGCLREISTSESAPLTGELTRDLSSLAPLHTVAAWIGRDSSGALSGELVGTVLEYLNMVFSLDGNALYFGARHLRSHAPALRRVVAAVGEIDAAQSVASFRAGTPMWTRPTIRDVAAPLRLADMKHPLVSSAVPNSIALGPPYGAIVTGSNMSGKSTFLRTLGVNVILAQTIDTCIATTYDGPVVIVKSSIGRADDISSGRSYYLVEVDTVLGLIGAASSNTTHLLLFDELFRGTNTIERIAAAEAVLHALAEPSNDLRARPIVVAATHDQELVDMLAPDYASFHFADFMGHDGLSFDYRLQPGAATTRNAIALLGLRGAPPSLVERALMTARSLERS